MGDIWGDGELDELPVHEVCINSFFISKYEVTQEQWINLMGSNPAKFRAGHNYPVENVSRSDIKEFIKRLNLRNHETYRLPTETEWEYAAKASGTPIKYATESGELNQELCNYDGTQGHDIWSRTSPAGSFPPNNSGLYDMCGNVWELVEDNYHFNAYEQHEHNNPLYIDSSSESVARGCGWSDSQVDCRISIRNKVSQDCPVCSRRNDIGFRLVKEFVK